MKSIVMHWTAGGARASALDKEHYHFLVEQTNVIVPGRFAPEANLHIVEGQYAAHTRSANTGRIGIALCGMRGAVERPFSPGPDPIRLAQVDVFCGLTAELCRRYGIEVSRRTVLTHAEVQPTLGIPQRGKWDIAWLPELLAPIDPVEAGDKLREKILKLMKG